MERVDLEAWLDRQRATTRSFVVENPPGWNGMGPGDGRWPAMNAGRATLLERRLVGYGCAMPGAGQTRMPRPCRGCDLPPDECTPAELPLTQTNNPGEGFPTAPKLMSGEVDLSLLRGRLSLRDAVTARFHNSSQHRLAALEKLDEYAVRYTTAGALRTAGFVVVHTPGPVLNGLHTSVVLGYDQEARMAVPLPWSDELGLALDACFAHTEGGDT